jgi:hypothetical protein
MPDNNYDVETLKLAVGNWQWAISFILPTAFCPLPTIKTELI